MRSRTHDVAEAGAHRGRMRALDMRGVLVGTTFFLALTGCGSTESQTTEPATGDDLGASSPSTPAPRGAREERSTEGDFRCRTLGNGTTVITWEDPHGFSDDNADGMVISGSAITKKDGGVLALYESYDDSPAISVADLEDLLTDPQ